MASQHGACDYSVLTKQLEGFFKTDFQVFFINNLFAKDK